MNRRGFTLLEMMVVMVVIGILTVTVLSFFFGGNHFAGVFSAPPSIAPTLLALDLPSWVFIVGILVAVAFAASVAEGLPLAEIVFVQPVRVDGGQSVEQRGFDHADTPFSCQARPRATSSHFRLC